MLRETNNRDCVLTQSLELHLQHYPAPNLQSCTTHSFHAIQFDLIPCSIGFVCVLFPAILNAHFSIPGFHLYFYVYIHCLYNERGAPTSSLIEMSLQFSLLYHSALVFYLLNVIQQIVMLLFLFLLLYFDRLTDSTLQSQKCALHFN